MAESEATIHGESEFDQDSLSSRTIETCTQTEIERKDAASQAESTEIVVLQNEVAELRCKYQNAMLAIDVLKQALLTEDAFKNEARLKFYTGNSSH